MKKYLPFMMHIGSGGNADGLGDAFRRLDEAGIPTAVMSADAFPYDFQEITKSSSVDHFVGYRKSVNVEGQIPPSGDVNVPNYDYPPDIASQEHTNWHINHLPPEMDGDVTWFTDINEPRHKEEDHPGITEWLAEYSIKAAEISWNRGYKYFALNFAAGNHPLWDDAGPKMRELYQLAADNPHRLMIGTHEYSWTVSDIMAGHGWLVGRIVDEVLDHMPDVPIVVSEFGWSETEVPEPAQAMQDYMTVAETYYNRSGLKYACTWYCGPGYKDIADLTQRLIAPLTELTLNTEIDIVEPETPTEPPTEPPSTDCPWTMPDVRRQTWLIPQDSTHEEIAEIWAEFTLNKSTITFSHDDGGIIPAHGNAERSDVVVFNPERWPFDILAWYEERGVNTTVRYFSSTPNEVFTFTHWPTPHRVVTQEFLANPQNYTQFGLPGHDGIDIRAYHGDPVYSVAGGTVSDVHPAETSHNYGIFVRIAHSDDYETTYAHLDRVNVNVGDVVSGGVLIGYADNTGNSSADHLHLTLKKKTETYTDRCGNVWPSNICDPTSFMTHFSGVTWPGGSPGFPCPGEPTEPEPPTGEFYTTKDFMSPDPRSFVVVDRAEHGGENVSTVFRDGQEFRVKNGSQMEVYEWRDGACFRIKDTSPADDPNHGPCLYLQYADPAMTQPGGQIAPARCQVAVTYEFYSQVQFKSKDGCQNLAYRSGWARSTFCLDAVTDNYTFENGVTVDRLYETTQTGEKQLYTLKDGVMRGWSGGGAKQHDNNWGAMPIEFYLDRTIQPVPDGYCD